ncbi:MAG: hypothetical protein ACR2F8_01940 [Caulobacteraceae bacterium]
MTDETSADRTLTRKPRSRLFEPYVGRYRRISASIAKTLIEEKPISGQRVRRPRNPP